HALVDAQRLDRNTVAVEQRQVGRGVGGLDLGEGRQGEGSFHRRGAENAENRRDSKKPFRTPLRPLRSQRLCGKRIHQGKTSTTAFGSSPNVSGAYIASARLGGIAKRPGLFSRTVYSTTCLPRGMYS